MKLSRFGLADLSRKHLRTPAILAGWVMHRQMNGCGRGFSLFRIGIFIRGCWLSIARRRGCEA